MAQPDPCLCLAPHTYCFFLVAALLARSLAFSVAARAVSLAFSVASLAVSTSVLEGASPVTHKSLSPTPANPVLADASCLSPSSASCPTPGEAEPCVPDPCAPRHVAASCGHVTAVVLLPPPASAPPLPSLPAGRSRA